MIIKAIKFNPRKKNTGPVQTKIEFECSEDLKKFVNLDFPSVYLINAQTIPKLSSYNDIIENRGIKDPRKGLSKLLLGREKIQLINGNYKSMAQIERSIYDLLENAVNQGENKASILGVDEEYFSKLFKKYEQNICWSDRPIGLDNEMRGDQDAMKRLEHTYFGDSAQIRKVRELILRLAKSDYSVIIIGPSGTGKELVAQEIHNNSKRKEFRFIPVNCGAIPNELFESQLFGHKKGAYTGATGDRKGLWEMADNGTLFLDEIGELRLDHQVKILRALEENQICPVGSDKPVTTNVRVIAATHRDLFAMIQQGKFREDLYYRLHVLMIRTPALKDHTEDIHQFVNILWEKIIKHENPENLTRLPDENKCLSLEVINEIAAHPWPGNVRQLKNMLRNLYATFWDIKPITPKDVAEIINYENTGYSESTARISRISQNKRAEEVIQSAENSLRALINQKHVASEDSSVFIDLFNFYLDEVKSLCAKPWLFSNENTYFVIDSLRSKLNYFSQMLPRDHKKALTFWKKEMPAAFKVAEEAILMEREELKDRA